MADLLYTTEEVFTSYLKGGRTYKVPEYQRGYKWSDKQITQLLDDISEFDDKADDETFYCLQNITLYPSKADEKVLNIVDGQQRLTTTFLLYCYLGLEEVLLGKFHYAVRESSNHFISRLQNERETFVGLILGSTSFDDFCEQNKNDDFDHQDIFYMYSAIRTFNTWLSHKMGMVEVLKEKMIHRVKFIVNEIHSDIKEQELFMNLNTGKVPLDGADLVRAIIITRVAREEMQNFSQTSIKDLVRLNEKRTRIGWELDQLNKWWAQDDVNPYYKAFCKVEIDPQETIEFNIDINPINILYRLWAETQLKTKEKLRLKLFENSDISSLKLYSELTFLNRTLQDWFKDRKIYHLLGYLANNQKFFRFNNYYKLWVSNNETRESFIEKLKDDVKEIVFGSEKDANSGSGYWLGCIKDYDEEDRTNWYGLAELERFLVLIDVIEISKNNEFKFLSPDHFKKNNEDKEHIYPCTPKNIKELANVKNSHQTIIQYLEKTGLPVKEIFPFDEKGWNRKNDLEKEDFLKVLESQIHGQTPINSIGNLVLLHYSINRGFGNDYYIDKRSSVIKNVQNGEYVRQHTLNVFVKNQSISENLNNWSFSDIKANADYIEKTISDFFNLSTTIDE